MSIRRSITDEIAGIPPDGSLLVEIARSRHPTTPCNGCDFRSVDSVCDYCGCTQPIDVGVTTVAEIAAANGYVKVGEEVAAMDFAIIYALSGCTDFEDNPASKINYLQCIRKLVQSRNWYIRLGPGQVVVQVEDLTRIVTWFKGDARTVPHTDMDTTLNRFAATIDAAKGEWK